MFFPESEFDHDTNAHHSVNLAIFQRKTGAKVDVPRKTYYW